MSSSKKGGVEVFLNVPVLASNPYGLESVNNHLFTLEQGISLA